MLFRSRLKRADSLEEIRDHCLAHVRRSRAEPGCLSHNVHPDCQNPLRLVFVEQWADAAALRAHFAVPASREFVRAIRALAAEETEMSVYEAKQITP